MIECSACGALEAIAIVWGFSLCSDCREVLEIIGNGFSDMGAAAAQVVWRHGDPDEFALQDADRERDYAQAMKNSGMKDRNIARVADLLSPWR